MRIDNISKRVMFIDENREQMDEKIVCGMRSKSRTEIREQKEKKMLLQ